MKFNRSQFVDDMRALVKQGVMFRHLGKDPKTGLDCIHAPAWGVRKQGIVFPEEIDREMEAYSEQPDGWKMIDIMRRWFIEIPVLDNSVPEAEPGDLLILYARRNPRHMAIKVAEDLIVEAYRSEDQKIGELLEHPLDPRRRIAACFRIPDFA